jgi:sugar phosphate isomerase/epimerase
MYIALSRDAVGIRTSGLQTGIEIAAQAAFRGLELRSSELIDLDLNLAKDQFAYHRISPAGFGLPVDFRKADPPTAAEFQHLEAVAKSAVALGTDRCATWIMPCSNDRQYDANFEFHVERLSPIAKVLSDQGVRLGLEFVGPKTLRDSQKYPFIFDINGMLRLGEAIGPNVGLLVDSFHWFCTGSDASTLQAVPTERIVYVHINDARANVAPEDQIDNQRELPAASGAIDAKLFLASLEKCGYDGPLVAEPFKDLSHLEDDNARAKLIAETSQAFLDARD